MNSSELSQSITRQIDDANESGLHIVAMFDLLPTEIAEIESATCFASLSTRSLVINLPFDRGMMREVREVMKRDGWNLVYEVSEREISDNARGKPTESYCLNGKRGDVTFFWNADREGSTCRRVKIGTATKEVPVYEFSCEAAE